MVSRLVEHIREKAKKLQKTIILPEGNDSRILEAARKITNDRLAKIILYGDKTNIERKARIHGVKLEGIEVRDGKDITAAFKALKNEEADGIVAGATTTTSELYKLAFKEIGTKNKFASTYFLMIKENKTFLFTDCALNIEPDEKQLVQIGEQSIESANMLGIIPRVAYLSFSTKGSAKHPSLEKIRKAANTLKNKYKNIPIDGELQVDAAIEPMVAKQKNPDSTIRGNSSILIFPDLNSGNIAYKLVERLSGYDAIGPISQGLNKPVNDLSRGCKVEDIINVVCITAIQAEK
ncbi:phosphate acetyltransferase [Candidatus Woesearchaeota archaeon]|nr:phosphate acetyltransferase [Candidatus Woesearchaeota archaeon]MCF7901399.1 phosphate acetyltransferase [Candidatus Woesearchaeota archaeon]MCF8013727.1 phosphate acetyltransferase [Candidatus Woesearchaeota archaeon]